MYIVLLVYSNPIKCFMPIPYMQMNNTVYSTTLQLTKSLWMKPLDSRYFMAEQIWTAMSNTISVFSTSSLCCLKYSSKQPNGEGRGETERVIGCSTLYLQACVVAVIVQLTRIKLKKHGMGAVMSTLAHKHQLITFR